MITLDEFNYRKSWSLQQKIDHSLGAIEQFYSHTDGKVYVSFSGGKDSTVLLHLIRKIFDSNVLAVFCNTGNEYPDIIKFVKSFSGIQIIHPKLTVREVIEKNGFPLISKEQSRYIREARHTKNPELLNKRLYGKKGDIFNGTISKKWQFLTKVKFDISERCCDYLKKSLLKFLKKRIPCILS